MEELKKIERAKILYGRTVRFKVSCGNMYLIINRDEELRVIEIFIILGKAGGCAAAQMEAVARLVSRCLRYGVPYNQIVNDLKGICCHSPVIRNGETIVSSCADAVAQVLAEEIEWAKTEKFKVVMRVEREQRGLAEVKDGE